VASILSFGTRRGRSSITICQCTIRALAFEDSVAASRILTSAPVSSFDRSAVAPIHRLPRSSNFNHNGKTVRSGSWYWLSTYKPVQHRTVCGTLGLRTSRPDCATWQLHPQWLNRRSSWREFLSASPTRRSITGVMPIYLLRSLRATAVAPAGHLGWSVEGPQRQGGKPKSQMPRHTSPQGIPASRPSGKLLSLAPLLRNGLLNLGGPHVCHRPGGHCEPPAYN
jgi:hypothetical protein